MNPAYEASALENGLHLLKVLGGFGLVVLVFFIWLGIVEYRSYGPSPKGALSPKNLQWEGSRISVIGSILTLFLFAAGLVLAYFIVLYGKDFFAGRLVPGPDFILASEDYMASLSFGLWFLCLAGAATLIMTAYSKFMMFAGLLGYWIASLIYRGKDIVPRRIGDPKAGYCTENWSPDLPL